MHQPTSAVRAGETHPRLVAALFTTAVFVNAALLFAVQPMFSKMVLPSLGGSPAVWNTCMVFFQTALLGGYLYAHVASSRLSLRAHTIVHVVLLLASLTALPIAMAKAFRAPSDSAPVLWLVGLLTVSLGAPFFLLSTGAPLLQRWFSRTGHPDADNPYSLYAASNLGSMVALLAYPLLLERSLTLATQSRAWTAVYVVLIALIAACAFVVRRGSALESAPAHGVAAAVDAEPISVARRLRWIALAFIPSSMLLGVTTYLSTDVAPIPLLWIAPLALYLLTFVFAFSNRVWFREPLLLALQAVFLVWIALTMAMGVSGLIGVMAPAHLAGLFLTGMICHGALAKDRPPVAKLTEFYLWMSFGGMLGGVFNALIAPHMFTSVAEYPIAIVLAALARPLVSKSNARVARMLDVALPIALAVVLLYVTRNGFPIPGMSVRASLALFAGLALTSLTFLNRPIRFGLALAAIFVAMAVSTARNETLLYRGRSFFGVSKVVRLDSVHALMHGTTTHGAQAINPNEALEPLTYYHRKGPVGQVFDVMMANVPSRRVGIIGLGSGAIACYGRANEAWTFYEIDPLVEQIALEPMYFTYLRSCAPKSTVVIGDGRLSLARAPDSSFDLIVIDAFGSDAIPVHLLTREALALYLSKLTPTGIVAFHISNRYLNLEPVVANVARSLNMVSMLGSDSHLSPEQRGPHRSLSKWVVVGRTPNDLAPLASLQGWSAASASRGEPWTDDFSNVLSVFSWKP